MNPFSVSWYVPLLDGGEGEWQSLDGKFRRGLPDELYAGRLVYRGLLMRACGRLKTVDGLKVSDGERLKAGELLGRIEGQQQRQSERRSKEGVK
jgi:protein NUD1